MKNNDKIKRLTKWEYEHFLKRIENIDKITNRVINQNIRLRAENRQLRYANALYIKDIILENTKLNRNGNLKLCDFEREINKIKNDAYKLFK